MRKINTERERMSSIQFECITWGEIVDNSAVILTPHNSIGKKRKNYQFFVLPQFDRVKILAFEIQWKHKLGKKKNASQEGLLSACAIGKNDQQKQTHKVNKYVFMLTTNYRILCDIHPTQRIQYTNSLRMIACVFIDPSWTSERPKKYTESKINPENIACVCYCLAWFVVFIL